MPLKSKANRQPREFPRPDGNPKPWYRIISMVCPSMTPEVLRQTVKRITDGEDRDACLLSLVAEATIEADRNVTVVHEEILDELANRNKRCEAEIREKQAAHRKLEAEAQMHSPEFEALRAKIQIRPKQYDAVFFDSDEPAPLEVIAAQHNLAGPEMAKPESEDKKMMIFAALAGAGFLTIGLLTLKGIELDRLTDSMATLVMLYILSLAVLGSLGTLFKYLGPAAGEHLYRLGVASKHIWKFTAWGFLLALPISATLSIAIETALDAAGFFKVIVEQDSMTTVKPGPMQVVFIAMFVSYPVIALYATKFLTAGYYRANLNKLMQLQNQLRLEIDAESWTQLNELSAKLQPIRREQADLAAKIAALRDEIRHELSDAERDRLEDMQDIAYSYNKELRLRLGLDDKEPQIQGKPSRPSWKLPWSRRV